LVSFGDRNFQGNEEFIAVTNIPGPKTMFDIAGYPLKDFCWSSGIPSGRRCKNLTKSK
jgi:hypothetical protein